jgi:hypothetical protein
METIADDWKRNFRTVTVRLSDGTTVTGKLNIGEYTIVSDFFRHSDHQFLVLSGAEHCGNAGKVMIVNRDEIIWVEMKLPSVK